MGFGCTPGRVLVMAPVLPLLPLSMPVPHPTPPHGTTELPPIHLGEVDQGTTVGASDKHGNKGEAPEGDKDATTDDAHPPPAPGAGGGATDEARGEGESKSEPKGRRRVRGRRRRVR